MVPSINCADTRTRLQRVVADIHASIDIAHDRTAPTVLYEHLRGSGWLAALVVDAEGGDDGPLRRIARLFEMVKQHSDLVSDARLAIVVPALRALIDAGEDPVSPDHHDQGAAVPVLTVHQSKGLEFATVFVVGVAEGRFPVRARRDPLALPVALTGPTGTQETDAHRSEERRLLYVAMTRARDELILSHAAAGLKGGRHRRPSVFLSEALGYLVDDCKGASTSSDEPSIHLEATVPPATSSPGAANLASTTELSFTQIDDYLSCPLKYRLRHQVRVPTPSNHALVFGSAMHQAVAGVNQQRLRGRQVDEVAAQATLDAHWSSEGFHSQEHEEARLAAGREALHRFVERSGAAAQDRIVAVEQPFSVRLDGDRVRGRYDAIREVPEGTVITDYKTGDVRDPAKARQRARSSLQLQLYGLAFQAETGALPAAVELHFLEGDLTGQLAPSARQLDGARAKVAKAARGIRDGDFEATPGFPACDWCPYRRICPAST